MHPPSLTTRLAHLLDQLAQRPVQLFLLLLALNAVALPYADLVHDAVLYRFQILNRVEGGAFADDLFFRYGSQDRYSVFALLAAPVVRVAGLSPGAFLLYVAGNAAFLLALQRFFLRLVPERALAVLGLLYVAVMPLPFGGNNLFPVNENYLTPRLFANALVLFGLERLLSGRVLLALGLLLAGTACHPLMAVSGLLIWAGWLLATHLRPTHLLGVLVVLGLAAAAVLAYEPLGVRVFGYMDVEWQAVEHRLVGYNFPDTWFAEDWLRIAAAFGIVLAAGRTRLLDSEVRRLVRALAFVAAVGLTATVLAGFLPYALLLQAQPYRALWLLQLVQAPLALVLVQSWFATGQPRLRAAGWVLLGYVGVSGLGGTALLYLLLLPFVLLAFGLRRRGLGVRPRSADWPWAYAGAAVLTALGCGVLLKLDWFASTVTGRTNFWHPIELNRYVHLIFAPFFQLLLCGGALLLSQRLLAWGGYHGVLLGVGLGVQVVHYALLQQPFWVEKLRPTALDVPFVREALRPHQDAAGRTLTAYWPCDSAELLWLDLRVNSFFHRHQLVSCLFSRPALEEAQRRIRLVERFEERWVARQLLGRATETDPEYDPPTEEDLLRLCQEEGLDFVILEQDFAGRALTTNGRWFVYDCRTVRDRVQR